LVVRRGPLSLLVNLGARRETFPLAPGGRLLAVSDPAVRAGELGISVPPDAVAIVELSAA
jgi:hypothetical protein